ncbi:MAG: photosynthetic reaction center subunit H [Paracoccaceae bacterium]
MTGTFFGEFDLASLTLWLFYIFFAALIFYIQRENMREGYPMTDDDGEEAANQGPFPVPGDKTFLLPHGKGELTVPSAQRPDRDDIAMARTGPGNGFPLEPTGDPLVDGIGAAAWANREDAPELDGHGHPKLVPMVAAEAFSVATGLDPRGLPVMSGDGEIVGRVTDMWVDEPEQMVRYIEMDIDPKWGSGSRLIPLTLARILWNRVQVKSLYGEHFEAIPKHASPRQVTKLEEDKISAYVGGGNLYADIKRQEPLL